MSLDARGRIRRPIHVARGNAYAHQELAEQVLRRRGVCHLQHDMDVANGSGATVRGDLNDALEALATLSSGATAPATTYPYQLWADTTAGLLKQRNAANTNWIVRRTLAESFVTSRASNTILAAGDFGKPFVATATFTQTLTAAATLGDGWMCYYRVNSGVTITFDPNASENIDGATTKVVVGPSAGVIFCSGSAFFTYGFDSPAASETVAGVIELATQAEVNAMTDTSRALTPNHNKIVLGTEVASTSGTSIDFTGIPAGVRRVTIEFVGVSTSGTSFLLIQLGDSGGVENTGYVSTSARLQDSTAVSVQTSTAGFLINSAVAANANSGKVVLSLEDASDHTWTALGLLTNAGSQTFTVSGHKATSAALDRVRITTVGGTDTFDAGTINVTYER